MESVKKWLSDRTAKKNGLYVHYSPPKCVVTAAQLRLWARGGAESRLERAVLAGQGRRLLAEAEALPLASHLPRLVAKCQALHAALERGSLLELQELIGADYNRRKYVTCLDEAGVGLLHKAIFYDYMDIAQWLVKNFPNLVHQKDSEGRTPLHYVGMCRDEAAAAALLEGAGAARGARDAAGRTPAHYRGPARTLLALPASLDMPPDKNPTGLVIKRHNIRIWCHDCDMSRLQRVVWEGHGTKLLTEVSNQPVVKRFLEAVPYIMNTIRDIHSVVIKNDLEGLMKHAGDPVPPQILSSRDSNNMTVLHKAAGLGHGGILNYIVDRYPQGINDVDNDGRTPLHYAAAVRDEQHVFNTLISLGADQGAVDNKNRTPGYYINRPQDIDKNLLKILPEAPRTASSAYPSHWDWKLLDSENIAEINKKSRRKNVKASNENISSRNNTNTVSDSTENRGGALKGSTTHEFIKGLPELDDSINKIGNNNKETEIVDSHDDLANEAQQEEEKDDTPNEENAENIENNTEKETAEDNDVLKLESIETHDNLNHTSEHTNYNEEPNVSDEETGRTNKNKHEDCEDEEKQTDNVQEDSLKSESNEPEEQVSLENEAVTEDKPESYAQEHVQNQDQPDDEPQNYNLEHEIPENKEGNNVISNGTEEDNDLKEEKYVMNDKEDDKQSNTDENTDQPVNGDDNIRQGSAVSTKKEGNNSSEHGEDDDDVQVQGDSNSEYSDFNHKSTAEISDSGSAKRGNVTDNVRNTQESLKEGVISIEAEQGSQNTNTQRERSVHGEVLVVDNEIDPEVTELLNTANMEMLATLVLNGEGSRLIGRRSGNSELQAFLNNVPTYMQKINKVHSAAKDGNIRDLQTALDRRKFAIARDPTSPNGSTPLHVATIFGKTNIIKYLGGRFPETLSAVDFEGRTALHYAAVLPDNGHYYNLLQQLGANSKDLDDGGQSAEDYYKNAKILPFNQLLSDFGISEEESREMFSDKGPSHADNSHMDIPIFHTDEGRYLAQSLGDPLIKGLTEVANVKPKDPVAFLASFLHNFPENKEKAQLGTQESEVIITQEGGEIENEALPLAAAPLVAPLAASAKIRTALPESQARERTATRPRPIDVVTVDPQPVTSPDAPEIAFSSANRDEHGQSMLHFAAARTHARNALFQLLQESDVSLGYRDELYRTARDVSIQANVPENTAEIDTWVLHLAARGNTEKIKELMLEGYDHILDVTDEENVPITEVISQRGNSEMSDLLASIPTFEASRETLHAAVRSGDLAAVTESLAKSGRNLARSQNTLGRTALHVAVLAQHEDIVAHLAQTFPELLRVGDNLERTPLHYAMGVEKIESLSRILIRAGAKRVLKDLKGRQPSYYFMNKSDILRLKEEEDLY